MRVLLFFCDIEGTLINGKQEVECTLLLDKINKLRELYNCDKCIFSLVSANEFTDVFNWYKKIKNHPDILLGKQFYDRGYFEITNTGIHINENSDDNSKLYNMKNYIQEIKQKYDIRMLLYADDQIFDLYENYFERVLNNNDVGIELIKPFNSMNNGLLDGLDSILIKNQKKRKYY